jgi:hypothetical protein
VSEERDSSLEEDGENVGVGDVPSEEEVVFGEGDFEEVIVGFKDEYRVEENEEPEGEEMAELLGLRFMLGALDGLAAQESLQGDEDGLGGLDLEEALFGRKEESREDGGRRGKQELSDDDFYKVKAGVGDFYQEDFYDEKIVSEEDGPKADYEGFVELSELKSFAEVEDERRSGRSVLEMAGFKDEDAEKRRSDRKAFLGY